MLPCVYNAWDTNSYPVFPRLQDVIAGQHPDVEERIRQAFAVGEDLGYRLPSPSPDGKQHFPAWSYYPRRTFELWEQHDHARDHVRVFSIDHPNQKALPGNHAEMFSAMVSNLLAGAGAQ